jgi:hypothetical protein
MTEIPVTDTLAMRAQKLTALSRAKSDNEKQTQDQTQLETALRKLNTELSDLATVLTLRRKLNEVGVPVQSVEALDKSAIRLRDQVEVIGRPTAQFVTARSREVIALRSDMADRDKAAWRAWAEDAIAQLPLGLVPRLNRTQRQQATARISELKKWTIPRPFSLADVAIFTTSLQTVRELLAGVGESNLDSVLAKFENGRVRLADLDEDELRMLREDGSLADQLYLVLS